MKNLKGGYQLIDLQGNDLSSGFTLEGLHQVITLSNNKPLLVTGIVISGTKKNDVYTTYTKSGTNYYVVVYDKKLKVANTDAVTITDFTEYDPEKAIRVDTGNSIAVSTSGTFSETILNKIKNNPSLVLKASSDSETEVSGSYLYPVAYGTLESSTYYQYFCVKMNSSSFYVSVIKVNKTSGAYTLTTKTIS